MPADALYELYKHSEYVNHVHVTDVDYMDRTLANLCHFSRLETIVLQSRPGETPQPILRFQQELLPSLRYLKIISWDAPLHLRLKATGPALHEVCLFGRHTLDVDPYDVPFTTTYMEGFVVARATVCDEVEPVADVDLRL